MSSLDAFKKNRKKFLSNVSENISSNSGSKDYEEDPRFWKPKQDKTGSYYSVIRFLPQKDQDPEKLPYISLYRHHYKYNSKWYINLCPTTLGNDCPQCKDNKQYWGDNATEADKAFARPRNRKHRFYANVLVLEDSACPENEGKVFIWDFPAEVMKMIDNKEKPKSKREKPIPVFDFWEGANFKIELGKQKIQTAHGEIEIPTYRPCEWKGQSALFDGNDNKIQEVYNQCHDLSEFIDPSKFKSYEELEKQVRRVCYDDGYAQPENIEEQYSKKEESKEIPIPESKPIPEQVDTSFDTDKLEKESKNKSEDALTGDNSEEDEDDFFSKFNDDD